SRRDLTFELLAGEFLQRRGDAALTFRRQRSRRLQFRELELGLARLREERIVAEARNAEAREHHRKEEQGEPLLQATPATQEDDDGDGAAQPNRQQRVAAVAPKLRVGNSEEEVAHVRRVSLRVRPRRRAGRGVLRGSARKPCSSASSSAPIWSWERNTPRLIKRAISAGETSFTLMPGSGSNARVRSPASTKKLWMRLLRRPVQAEFSPSA